jgi:hypothetical protein
VCSRSMPWAGTATRTLCLGNQVKYCIKRHPHGATKRLSRPFGQRTRSVEQPRCSSSPSTPDGISKSSSCAQGGASSEQRVRQERRHHEGGMGRSGRAGGGAPDAGAPAVAGAAPLSWPKRSPRLFSRMQGQRVFILWVYRVNKPVDKL